MKILLVTNILSPYRKSFYDRLHEELKKRSINFEVFVMASTEPDREWDYNDYRSSFTRLLPHKTIKIGKNIVHLNFGLRKKLKSFQPDIIIASGSYTFFTSWITLNFAKKNKILSYFWSESHQQEIRNYSKIKLFFRTGIRNVFYKKPDGFWYSGKLSKEFIEFYSKKGAKYVFVPNLIDETKFHYANQLRKNKNKLREKWQVSVNKYIFVCPARLSIEKGIIPFIELLEKFNNKTKIEVLILGDGPLKKDITALIKKYGLNIKLLGYQDESSIIELYALSDCFLLPSLSDPNPLSCIEALWSGLPLFISCHVGNHYEVIDKINQNGYIFSYEKKESFYKGINNLVDSSEKWKEEASNISINIASKVFNTSKAVSNLSDELLNHYNIRDSINE